MSFVLNRLIGFGAKRAAGGAAVVYTDESLRTTDETTASFTSQSIGTAATGRIIVVAAGTVDTATNSISSATINGVSATVVGNAAVLGGGAYACIGMVYAVVDTDTSVTIDITWASSVFRTHIGVWAIYGAASSTPHDSGTSTADPGAVSGIDVPAGGVAIGASAILDGSTGGTFTWTNLTEDYDVNGEASNEQYSGASGEFAAAQSGITITADPSAADATATIVASWG